MADPVSSVAYALEAALHHLDGDLASLVPTMALVVLTIGIVCAAYHQLVARFPGGGGGAEALAAAFGEGWAFLPVGALLVDFVLTIAVSCAAGASALIAAAGGLASGRTLLAAGLAVLVAAGTLLGHRGRIWFATATLAFCGLAAVVIVQGLLADPAAAREPVVGDAAMGAALLAMPLGMALATGVEAPSNAIAQLGELDDPGRRRFGQGTLWLMLAIVGGLTLSLAVIAVRLGVGEPGRDSTLLADVAHRATGGSGLFDAFQVASALLLLAAAASSFLAGSGLLAALARHGGDGGLLPSVFARVNRRYAPPWGIALLLGSAVVLVVVAGGREQVLVRYYAVAVFASFLGALVAASVLAARDGRRAALVVDVCGALIVAFVLALNVGRLDGIVSLAAAAVVSLLVWRAWVRAGRPGGVTGVVRQSAA